MQEKAKEREKGRKRKGIARRSIPQHVSTGWNKFQQSRTIAVQILGLRGANAALDGNLNEKGIMTRKT